MNGHQEQFRVRFSECDSLGHLNNAVFAQYLQETAMAHSASVGWPLARYLEESVFWVMRRLTIEYLKPALYGETVDVQTWISEMGRATAHREFRVQRGEETLALARTFWAFVDLKRGRPVRTPPEIVLAVQPLTAPALTDFEGQGDPQFQGRAPVVFQHERRVQHYELDPLRHVNNAVYLHWFEQAVAEAIAAADYSYDVMRAQDSAIFQRRHAIEFLRPALDGDRLEIRSSLAGARRVTGTWLQEIRRPDDGALIARNYNTGVCVSLDGRPQRCPDAVVNRLAPLAAPPPDR